MLVTGAWWVVRGPMIQEPVAKVPDVDLDLAGPRESTNVRSAGPISLQPLPPTAAAFASAAAAAGTPCGLEEEPKLGEFVIQDGDAVRSQIKAAGPGWVAAQAHIDAALRASADPFDHAVADLVNAGDMRTSTGRLDALVQQAVDSSDARVYALAFRACQAERARELNYNRSGLVPASCAALTAIRWATLDPGDGIPWIAALSQATADGNVAAQQDAFVHLTEATRFDSRRYAATAAVLARAPVARCSS